MAFDGVPFWQLPDCFIVFDSQLRAPAVFLRSFVFDAATAESLPLSKSKKPLSFTVPFGRFYSPKC
jgi:hypothetical protein